MVKRLFREHERAADSDPQRATDLKREIISELERHSKMEEQIVYPALKEKDEELFHEATEEHHAVDLLIGEVTNATPDNPAYKAKMSVLRENVEHHIEEEEGDGFKQLKKLSPERLTQIARRWQEMKEEGIPAFMQAV
jgi:hypothetical protein